MLMFGTYLKCLVCGYVVTWLYSNQLYMVCGPRGGAELRWDVGTCGHWYRYMVKHVVWYAGCLLGVVFGGVFRLVEGPVEGCAHSVAGHLHVLVIAAMASAGFEEEDGLCGSALAAGVQEDIFNFVYDAFACFG